MNSFKITRCVAGAILATLLMVFSGHNGAQAQDMFSDSLSMPQITLQDMPTGSNVGITYMSLKNNHNIGLKAAGVYFVATALTANGYVLNKNGYKGWGHASNAAGFGLFTASPFLINYDRHYRNQSRFAQWSSIVGTYILANVANAAGDALIDKGQPGWGYSLNGASRGILAASPLWINYDHKKWAWYFVSCVTIRVSFFDYTYNATRGLPLEYVGTSSGWDKLLQEFKPSPSGNLSIRALSLLVGVSVPINELSKKHNR